MDPPLWVVLPLLHALLLATGIVMFFPGEPHTRVRGKELRRLAPKYVPYFGLLVLVLVTHFLILTFDAWATGVVGWDFAGTFADLEGTMGPDYATRLPSWAIHTFAIDYLFLHPFILYFAPLLFILMDDERAARASLIGLPTAYLVAAGFYLFLPTSAPYVHFAGFTSPLFTAWPELAEWTISLAGANDSFPAFPVAAAIIIANASRFSRNRNFRYFAFAHVVAVTAAAVLLGIHWAMDVAGGVLVAAIAATFTARLIDVERLVLQRVKPLPATAQAVHEAADILVAKTQSVAGELGFDGEAILVGSVAKDTYLVESVDVDVFFAFPPDLPREDLETRGLALGKAVLGDHEIKYAEHPYVHGRFRGFAADLVPCYKIDNVADRMSAVDRTPFHTSLVKARLDRSQRDDVRLIKQFMKGIGVYGADARVQGFSGYMSELLVLKYGTFGGVLDAVRGWKPGTYLVLDAIECPPVFRDPLVFIDPVDAARNAGSAVREETLARFAEAARAYRKKPALRFFFPRALIPRSPTQLTRAIAKRRGTFVLLSFEAPEILEDHLHNQLRKATSALSQALDRHEFDVKGATYEAGAGKEPCRILIEVARDILPESILHAGPPVKAEMHAQRFRKGWDGNPDALGPVIEKDGRLFVERRRKHRDPRSALIAEIPGLDLGRQVGAAIREDLAIQMGPEVVGEGSAAILTRHLDARRPWER